MSTSLADFKAKNVPGLYTFNHFEHPDGRWIQVSIRGDQFVYLDAKASIHNFNTLEALKSRLAQE